MTVMTPAAVDQQEDEEMLVPHSDLTDNHHPMEEIWSSIIVPHLRIPGLNAPIPCGAGYVHHHGGWGKSPVDEDGFTWNVSALLLPQVQLNISY
ncbi:hypothetical protein COLO4_27353 [Corchorus olitorius]|uniref:Uncharacterized protein n=1 Tax=Corchorus olitorius TaxID=93759 RepID=A0A1R3HS56_9ROSI|nr:hypothetical protein COLO4_27353 [Corchorus olitorius]